MDNKYVTKEVDKIINNKTHHYPLNISMAACWIIANLKGINLKIFDVSEQSSLSDYFVLASAGNSVQARAMIEQILKNLKRHKYQPNSCEGLDGSDWVLIDFGDIIIHIFQETTRDIYDLDSIWQNAPLVPIPQEYYYTDPQNEEKSLSDPDDYY